MDPLSDLLTVDIGNSTIDCRRAVDGARLRLPQDEVDLAPLLAFAAAPVRRCVIVSVVAPALARVRAAFAMRSCDVRVAGVELPCPLPLDYTTPHTLGADRWVGACAAHRRYGRAVVVDCGTATTVNLVDADGTFRGGAIAPGLRAFVAGLAAVAPALPVAALDSVPTMPPRSTQAAVDAGVVIGYAGLVERLVAAALAASRGPATVVVTGGNAERLRRVTRLRAEFVPDLVHQGLVFLAEGATWTS